MHPDLCMLADASRPMYVSPQKWISIFGKGMMAIVAHHLLEL